MLTVNGISQPNIPVTTLMDCCGWLCIKTLAYSHMLRYWAPARPHTRSHPCGGAASKVCWDARYEKLYWAYEVSSSIQVKKILLPDLH